MTFSRQQKGITQRADIFAGWETSCYIHNSCDMFACNVCSHVRSQHASWWLLGPYLLSMSAVTVQ